jgi:hypothetical protein
MTRFRQWVATATLVASLLIALATVASAAPGNGKGGGGGPTYTTSDCISPDGGSCTGP